MTFEIKADGVDVERVLREIRETIEEKKKAGLLTDEEIREVANHPLRPVLQAHDLESALLAELLEQPSRWNYTFDADTLYRSSRGSSAKRRCDVRPSAATCRSRASARRGDGS